MTPEEIAMMLTKISSDLEDIFKSRGWEKILQLPHANDDLEINLGNALFHTQCLKLHVRQALDKNLTTKLDKLFQEVA